VIFWQREGEKNSRLKILIIVNSQLWRHVTSECHKFQNIRRIESTSPNSWLFHEVKFTKLHWNYTENQPPGSPEGLISRTRLKNGHWSEGCPIHPTRVDLSLELTIQLTGSQFENPLWWNWHDSSSLMLIRYTGSWFAQDLENIAHLGYAGWVENVDSTRFNRIDTNCLPWCPFDLIRLNRHESSPLLLIRLTGSRFALD